jgi:hypothetical protein
MEKSITYKYELKNIGIGDLTFFCGEMLLRLNKEDILEIQISQNSLNLYRDGSESYKKFCVEYVKFILSDFVVLECETKIERTWEVNRDYIDKMLIDDRVKDIFKEKFSNDSINDEYKNHVVLFTKSRNFHLSNFQQHSEFFFNTLNSIDSKIILLGEKNVNYTGEYSIIGNEMVYSLYDEYIKNIDKNKIIDLTKDDYSSEGINLENIINDLTLILNSKKIIMMGGGGFFCMSLFTDKLLSLVNEEIFYQFQTEHNKQIFINFDDYIREIQNV